MYAHMLSTFTHALCARTPACVHTQIGSHQPRVACKRPQSRVEGTRSVTYAAVPRRPSRLLGALTAHRRRNRMRMAQQDSRDFRYGSQTPSAVLLLVVLVLGSFESRLKAKSALSTVALVLSWRTACCRSSSVTCTSAPLEAATGALPRPVTQWSSRSCANVGRPAGDLSRRAHRSARKSAESECLIVGSSSRIIRKRSAIESASKGSLPVASMHSVAPAAHRSAGKPW
mmetsp:Transcript_3658/g.8249  ORF Transcript_3658/g.8249 Transcript_3658/m.8249 type:complete len:229 (-) Transcript_3658:1184-1870(-)